MEIFPKKEELKTEKKKIFQREKLSMDGNLPPRKNFTHR